jgi:mannose-6-phosphate isomerase-like protein (cupin superfamily)
MPQVIPLAGLSTSPTAWLFEGRPHAGAEISFFVTQTPPGKGPGLHVHPYTEVFLVEDGEATFTVGEEQLVVAAGNILVVPPVTPHGFKNRTERPLRVFSVHDSGEVSQTWLEDD